MTAIRTTLLAAVTLLGLTGCGGGGGGTVSSHATPRAARTPAPRTDVAAVAARAHVPILCYHQIRNPTGADGAAALPYIVAPKRFAAQMDALDRAGFTTVTGDALVAHVARGVPLPHKPILLTFDDGSAGQYTRALPILRRHHFVATFFVMTVVLGKPGWLTKTQVKALDRSGMTIGNHTWDHHAVTGYSDADWITQLAKPKLELTRLLGHKPRLFAYPFGEWNAAAFPYLQRGGIDAAFQLGEKLDRAHPLYTIRRIIVPSVSGAELMRDIRQDF